MKIKEKELSVKGKSKMHSSNPNLDMEFDSVGMKDEKQLFNSV